MKILSYILSPLFYLAFFLVLLIFQPLQWLWYNLGGYRAHERIVHLLNGSLTATYYILGTQVYFENHYQLPENRSILFIANHQSMLDIPALSWYVRRFHPKFISKKELVKIWPSIGYNLKKSGAALVNRSDSVQALQEIERLGHMIHDNRFSAVLFPEGTRSKSGIMKPFKYKGFAKMLELNPGALVVPVCIENSWKIFSQGNFPLVTGVKMRFSVLKPIEPGSNEMSEVIGHAESAIRKQLGQEEMPLYPSSSTNEA